MAGVVKGYVRHAAAQLTENSALGAGPVRDNLVNNANHIADEAGQVLLNWTATTASTYLTPTLVGGVLDDADTYYRIARFGPFPLLMKSDGSSYALRGRLRGYLSAAGTATYIAVICTPGRSLAIRDSTTALNSLKFSTTVTTDAWDDANVDNIATLDTDEMALAMTTQSTLVAVAGAAVSVQVPLVTVTIYAQSTVTTSVPRLTGFYLAEYVGL